MANPEVGIISLGLGNISSVVRMLHWIEIPASAIEHPEHLDHYSHLILPGVGHFTEGTNRLTDEWRHQIHQRVQLGTPLLGICLGMQLLCSQSEEGEGTGLNLFPYTFNLIPHHPGIRVPHMGWNQVFEVKTSILLAGIEHPRFYFVHSFYADGDESCCAGLAHYGVDVAAVLESKNIFGVQFHPEKSHSFGMKLLQNFYRVI